MMFAVIKTGGKQYRVAADDLVKVEKITGNAGDMIEFNEVLLVGNGDKTTIGTPLVDGALVTAELVDTFRGQKVISFKKRRRQNSKRTRGHRQWLTTLRISEILTDGAKPSKKAAKKPAKAEVKPEDQPAGKVEDKKAAPMAESKTAEAKAGAKPETEAKTAQAAPLFSAPEGKGDDLTKIKGIGPVAKKQLNEQGITTFGQLASLSDEDIARIDENMPFSADQINDWREQAGKLAE
jgi:large subunit ribosomal protein L21